MSERFFPDGMPPPLVDATSLPWWKAAADHRLVVQQCTACEHTWFPPSPVCPECRSSETHWKEVSGEGEVYSYTIVHRPIAPDQQLPYFIVVIALDGSGGVRMISNLVGASPDQLEIGMRVELVWEDMSEELVVPRFRPRQ